MARLAPTIISVFLLAPAASAAELFPVEGGAVFNALPGEANRVWFKGSAARGTFADARNPVATDAPCVSLTSGRARCPLGGPNVVGVSLGDGNDRFRVLRGSRLPRGSIIEGGRGADRLRAGPGREKIGGGRGNDVIFAGKGRDIVYCGSGRDRVIAEPQDKLRGCERIARP